MKKMITLVVGMIALVSFSAPAFAEVNYVQYNLEIVADGAQVYPSTPVRAPEKSEITFSATSPTAKEDVLFSVAVVPTKEGYQLYGQFQVKDGKKVVVKSDQIGETVKKLEAGRFHFSYGGKAYEALVTPVKQL